jgi:hypothetical protein
LQLTINLKDNPKCEVYTWFPVIEHDYGQERFLVEDPAETIRRVQHYRVPILAGRTEHEFSFMMSGKKLANR